MSMDNYKKAAQTVKKKTKAPLMPLSHLDTKWYNVLQTSDAQKEEGKRKYAPKAPVRFK